MNIAAVIFMILTNSMSLASSQTTATPDASLVEPSMSFKPGGANQSGFINWELEPGETSDAIVILSNSGDEEILTTTYAIDAFTATNGGFNVVEYGTEPTGVTTWLDYETEDILIRSGQSVEKTVAVSVPLDAAPGEYVAGLVMQSASDQAQIDDETLLSLNLVSRVVVPIRIVVPGVLNPEVELGQPVFLNERGVYAVIFPIKNTGNVQTSLTGNIEITATDGSQVLSAPVVLGRVYGGHETTLWLGLSAPLPVGEYDVSVVLKDEAKGVHVEARGQPMSVAQATSAVSEPIPVSFTASSAAPMPASDNIQFLRVDASITNTTEEPVANAQLSLIAKVDGEEIERFPISQSLSVPPGDTDVSTRYIPLTGWTSGEWEFELLLETVEGSGAAVVVDRVPLDVKVTVP